MAKFQFRLQSILNLKEKVEDQKKLDYGQALAKVEMEKRVMERLIGERNEMIAFFRNSVNAKVDPGKVGSYNNYIELLKKK